MFYVLDKPFKVNESQASLTAEERIWLALEMDAMSVELQADLIAKSPTFTYSCPSVGGCNTATCSTRSNTSCSC